MFQGAFCQMVQIERLWFGGLSKKNGYVIISVREVCLQVGEGHCKLGGTQAGKAQKEN